MYIFSQRAAGYSAVRRLLSEHVRRPPHQLASSFSLFLLRFRRDQAGVSRRLLEQPYLHGWNQSLRSPRPCSSVTFVARSTLSAPLDRRQLNLAAAQGAAGRRSGRHSADEPKQHQLDEAAPASLARPPRSRPHPPRHAADPRLHGPRRPRLDTRRSRCCGSGYRLQPAADLHQPAPRPIHALVRARPVPGPAGVVPARAGQHPSATRCAVPDGERGQEVRRLGRQAAAECDLARRQPSVRQVVQVRRALLASSCIPWTMCREPS